MEEIPRQSVRKTSGSASSASPRVSPWTEGDKDEGATDVLDAEVQGSDDYAPPQTSDSEEAEDGDHNDASTHFAAHFQHKYLPGSINDSDDNGAQAPRRSKHKPATDSRRWERNPEAYPVKSSDADITTDLDLIKPPANSKAAHARADWPPRRKAKKKKYLASKTLGSWSEINGNRTRKAVTALLRQYMKREVEENATQYEARP